MTGSRGGTCILVLVLALAGCVASDGQAPAHTGGTSGAATRFDGQYRGSGRLLSGTGCPGGEASFPVSMVVAEGAASMPLMGGARGLSGPVGPDGGLEQLRWRGDVGVVGEARGRIANDAFELDYVYDWPAANAVRCRFRYEGRR